MAIIQKLKKLKKEKDDSASPLRTTYAPLLPNEVTLDEGANGTYSAVSIRQRHLTVIFKGRSPTSTTQLMTEITTDQICPANRWRKTKTTILRRSMTAPHPYRMTEQMKSHSTTYL